MVVTMVVMTIIFSYLSDNNTSRTIKALVNYSHNRMVVAPLFHPSYL